eukprot:gene12838-4953_t
MRSPKTHKDSNARRNSRNQNFGGSTPTTGPKRKATLDPYVVDLSSSPALPRSRQTRQTSPCPMAEQIDVPAAIRYSKLRDFAKGYPKVFCFLAEESLAAEAAKKRSRKFRPALADMNAAPSDHQPGMLLSVHWPLQSPCHTLLPECTGLDQHDVLGNSRLPDDNVMPAPSCTFTLPMPSPSSELPPVIGCCPPSSAQVPQTFYSEWRTDEWKDKEHLWYAVVGECLSQYRHGKIILGALTTPGIKDPYDTMWRSVSTIFNAATGMETLPKHHSQYLARIAGVTVKVPILSHRLMCPASKVHLMSYVS